MSGRKMRSTALPIQASSMGRLADDGGGVDGVLAVGDAGEVEDGVVVLHGVEAGVVAEGAFGAELAEFDVAFEDVSRRGRGLRGRRSRALTELDGLLAKEAGDEVLLDLRWRGDDGGEGGGGVGADGDGDLHAVFADFGEPGRGDGVERGRGGCAAGGRGPSGRPGEGAPAVAARRRSSARDAFAATFWRCQCMPVVAVVDLHAVHADVALAGFGSRVMTQGRVMKRPPSCGQVIGGWGARGATIVAALRMTCLQGASLAG